MKLVGVIALGDFFLLRWKNFKPLKVKGLILPQFVQVKLNSQFISLLLDRTVFLIVYSTVFRTCAIIAVNVDKCLTNHQLTFSQL